jgi:hypothetical protein
MGPSGLEQKSVATSFEYDNESCGSVKYGECFYQLNDINFS